MLFQLLLMLVIGVFSLIFAGILVGAFMVLFVVLLKVAQESADRRRRAFVAMGAELGLKPARGGRLRGRRHGRDVEIWEERRKQGDTTVTVTVVAASGPPADLVLRPQPFLSLGFERDDVIGDREFDRAWIVRVDQPASWAALNADARAWLQRERRRISPTVCKGWVRSELQGSLADIRQRTLDVEAVAARLDLRGDAVRGQCASSTVLRRMMESDPQPGIRGNALGALLELLPREEATTEARQALHAREPELVEVAAHWLPDPAGLRRVAAWKGAHWQVRRTALDKLLDLGDLSETAAALDGLFTEDPTDKPRALWREGCRLVAQKRRKGLSAPIVRLVFERLDPDAWGDAERYRVERQAALWAARALGQQDGDVESALLRLLGAPDMEVRVAAADALGAVGTVAAVPELTRLAAGAMPLTAARRKANEAIAAIQSRAVVGAGALALADVGAGALSEAVTGGALAEAGSDGQTRAARVGRAKVPEGG